MDRVKAQARNGTAGWRTSWYSTSLAVGATACVQVSEAMLWLDDGTITLVTGPRQGAGKPDGPVVSPPPTATPGLVTVTVAESVGHAAAAETMAANLPLPRVFDQQLLKDNAPEAAGGRIAPTLSRAVSPGTVLVDYQSVDELVADLNAGVLENSGSPVPDVLGPDLFGLLTDPPPPSFLTGHDYTNLSTGRSISFLRALDITHAEPPSHEDMNPTELIDHRDLVEVAPKRLNTKQRRWAPARNIPLAPKNSEMPWMLFAIWLGGPLADSGKMGEFRKNFANANNRIAENRFADKVLITDVPRRAFIEVRDGKTSRHGGPHQAADIRSMLGWAQENSIRLINVDELFNSEYPMRLGSLFRTEMNKQIGMGYAAASDILRLEVIYRFGGIYSDGDNHVKDLTTIPENILDYNRRGYWVFLDEYGRSNSVVIAFKGHPFVGLYLDLVKEKYAKTQSEVMSAVIRENPFRNPHDIYYRVRRYSTIWRTGPRLLYDLDERLGYDEFTAPNVFEGIENGGALSWIPAPPGSESSSSETSRAPWDRSSTLAMTQKIVQTLVRNLLHNRPGDLHLTMVAEVIAKHPRPDLIWMAVLSFIASRPHLAEKVRSVTNQRYIGGKVETVNLPEAAQHLLKIPTEGRAHLGEYQYPATVIPLGIGGSGPTSGW
jgi:hypothetical protein